PETQAVSGETSKTAGNETSKNSTDKTTAASSETSETTKATESSTTEAATEPVTHGNQGSYTPTHSDPKVQYYRESVEIADGWPGTSDSTNYVIKVNVDWNVMTVYDGDTPVLAFPCSTAREGYITPCDTYYTGSWYFGDTGWCYMADGTYGQYAYSLHRASDDLYDGYMIHTVCYYTPDRSDLETYEYNKLGGTASMGCIRLCVGDARWVMTHVGPGSTVIVYSDPSSPGPLGKPSSMFIPPEVTEICSWDPTDPVSANPWHSYDLDLLAPDKIEVAKGASFSATDYLQVMDCYGYDLTQYVYTSGSVDTATPGSYTVNASVSIGPIYASKDIEVVVK
ncbi:MAG: L,D-transpeptidase, partial [Parasporobacterium sp.]|nr:L,D-transpeptidase [Parasporobacterium sp.]